MDLSRAGLYILFTISGREASVMRLRSRAIRACTGIQNTARMTAGRLDRRFLRYGRHRSAPVAGNGPPAIFIFGQLAHFLRTGRHSILAFALAVAFELLRGRWLRSAAVSERHHAGAGENCEKYSGLPPRAS